MKTKRIYEVLLINIICFQKKLWFLVTNKLTIYCDKSSYISLWLKRLLLKNHRTLKIHLGKIKIHLGNSVLAFPGNANTSRRNENTRCVFSIFSTGNVLPLALHYGILVKNQRAMKIHLGKIKIHLRKIEIHNVYLDFLPCNLYIISYWSTSLSI